jgi:serine/threonine-protein kinase
LLQEARAAARLGHPAIARVFDYGLCERGHAFIVMELLEGEDLAVALARRGRLSPTKAVQTMLPIAHALDAAHQKGIVHRDIKPENIYLARGEDRRVQPKLVDFGIAKMERNSSRLTQTGTMLGSPLYMSPEQARGDDVDHLADVWAVCVVLYEMIAGRTPFEGKNYNALLYAIIADEPTPLTDIGFGDGALWQILRRGFEKDPVRRWQSIRDLAAELARWLISHGQREDITGASLNLQWLRRVRSSADLLSSMAPPPYGSTSGTSLEELVSRVLDSNRPTEIDGQPAFEGEPSGPSVDEATLTGRVVSLPARMRQRRLLVIALGSAALGAAAAVALLVRNHEEAADLATPPTEPSSIELRADVTEPLAAHGGRPLAAAERGDDSATQARVESNDVLDETAVGDETTVGDETAVRDETSAPTSSDFEEAAELSSAAKATRKAPLKRPRAAKKSKLKNPFD